MFLLRLATTAFVVRAGSAAVGAGHARPAHNTPRQTAAHHHKPHGSVHHKSPHHSTPRHHAAPKVTHQAAPKASSFTSPKHMVFHHSTTRAFRQTTPVNRTTVNKTVVDKVVSNHFSTRVYYRRPSGGRNYFSTRYSSLGGRSWLSSGYMRRHHHHRRRSNGQQVVRGVVQNTTGTANAGTVQVKVLPRAASRFRYGAAVTVPKNAQTRTYNVNGNTRYTNVVNANGGTRTSSFKDVEPGKPVLLLTHNRTGNFVPAVEIFPKN